MATYTITIPNWHPARLNQYASRHWAVRRAAKAEDQRIVGWELAARFNGRYSDLYAPGRRRVGLTIVLGPRQRGGDPDSYWKSLLDALVAAGALLDDSKEWVELAPVQYERGEAPATILTLEDLPTCEMREEKPKRGSSKKQKPARKTRGRRPSKAS